ncbi:expressed unknown protein [Ectocarpus siliculosus]|uniref:Uncharacterized protein n=1 Tax=Ectocarpus siliculosus TaxID=2880 RepID=D8LCL9_ECTSI|nr:expressed unknown protein [Ectocarpus siliculosus]|eukprot:CBN79532.1 expressed unknown protein [Ectocarpus siliculosus]
MSLASVHCSLHFWVLLVGRMEPGFGRGPADRLPAAEVHQAVEDRERWVQ